MASEITEAASPENDTFFSEEYGTYDISTVKKRRRKKFLWNSQVSVLSRRKWRTKRSNLAKDPRLNPHLNPESDEHSDCQAGCLFGTGSSSENEAENTLFDHI